MAGRGAAGTPGRTARRGREGPLSRSPAARVSLALLALACGCGGQPEPEPPAAHQGPILLVTIDALRADVVGGLGGVKGLTPALDRLIAEAHWAGRAVAPASSTVPAMASLWTGLQPWEHGLLAADRAVLREELMTLPEALKGSGYATAAYRTSPWLTRGLGYAQGFDVFRNLGHERAAAHLAAATGGPEFVWVHIFQPHAPYLRRDRLLPRLGDPPPDLPARLRALDLAPYAGTGVPLPDDLRRALSALYRLNTAWADEQLGALLDALRASGRFDDALVLVAADHGEELGEQGQVGHGSSLGRAQIEVPLVVKLPRGSRLRVAARESDRVGTVRLWATVLEAVGGAVPEAVAPSLFRVDEAPGILSELYLGNGTNELSLVEDGYQLRWTSRFAQAEREYEAAVIERQSGRPGARLSAPAEALFDRLGVAFVRASPLLGGGGRRPKAALVRWTGAGAEPVADPERQQRMVRLLKRRWLTTASRLPGRPGHPPGTPPLTAGEDAALAALGGAL